MQYLVTSYSFTKGCKKYFKTAPKANTPLMVVEYGTGMSLYPEGTKLYKVPASKYPGNTVRFISLFDIMKADDFGVNDWFIFTDTHDVFFQGEIPDLSANFPGADLVVSNEGKQFRDIDFWKDRVPADMQDYQAYNTGTFAMKRDTFIEFLLAVRKEWDNMRKWYVQDQTAFPFSINVVKHFAGSVFNSYADTIIFNRFVHQHAHVEDLSLMSVAAFNLELGNIYQKRGVYYTKDHEKIAIVHLNGSTGK